MSSSNEILAPLLAKGGAEKRRTTLRTGGRRALVVKDILPKVRYSFIKIGMKLSLLINHFHQKPLSSKTIFIKNHFHQKPLSSKTTFIKNHFRQKPLSSETIFIRTIFLQTIFIKIQFHPISSKTISSTITHCQKPFSSKNHPRQYQSHSMSIVISQPSTVFSSYTPNT